MTRPTCCIPGCDMFVHAWQMCRAHYLRDAKGATVEEMLKPVRRRDVARTCELDGCDEKHYATGLCRWHYRTKWAGRDPNTLRRNPNMARYRGDRSPPPPAA